MDEGEGHSESSSCSVCTQAETLNVSTVEFVSTSTGRSSGTQCTVTTSDIASTSSCSPCQPHITFPVTMFSGKARSFNPEWYKKYSWLEYSVAKDAAFCFPCRFFFSPSTTTNRPEKTFTEVGFRNCQWKDIRCFTKHNDCYSHKQSVIAWEQFLFSQKHSNIAEQLGSARDEVVKKNRHYVKSIIEVLLLCSKQEISFRGHVEGENSLNKGNFREILELVASHDPVIEDRLLHGPKNAKYTSPTIQNNILSIMAKLVRKKICDSVQISGYFSIMADETKDLSKQEQLSIVLRYVDVDAVAVSERFLTFFPAKNLNAESLSTYILEVLSKFGLNPKMMISQGYDGASVMSGRCNGVQQRIRVAAPYAAYIHCHAHVLNLVLVDCVKKNSYASDFFSLVQNL